MGRPVGYTAVTTAGSSPTHTLGIMSGSHISRHNPNSPPPLHHFGRNVSMTNNSLVEVMDALNRSLTNQYTVLQETLRQ